MMQQPPTCNGASMMNQQQQHQPQPTTTTTTTTTSTTAQEEEEEFRKIWIGNSKNWMDKVEEEEDRTLWIGNLQHWMDEAYIDSCFSHTGEVFTSKVIRNTKTTGKSSETCYGFILFKSHAIAENFLDRFDGTPMPRVAVRTDFSLNWAAKVVVTDGTTTMPWNEIPAATAAKKTKNKKKKNKQKKTKNKQKKTTTATTTTAGQCEMNCMFCSTAILPSIGPATNKKTLGGDSQFSTVEMGDKSSWRHMLKCWSLSQFKGTCNAHTVHATHRVYAIAVSLFIPHRPLEDRCPTPTEVKIFEELLDELHSHTETINVAKELHSMGVLELLLRNMSCKHAGVGARAAKIVSTMVQNNPRSQELVMEAGGGEHLLNTIFCSVDATTETNVLSAISSICRNKNIPRITAFRQRNWYEGLYCALGTASVGCQRKALNLIHRLVSEHKSDCNIVTGLGYHRFMMKLASGSSALVRVAALKCLLLLTEVEEGGNRDQLVKNDDQLKQVLEKLKKKNPSALDLEDISALSLEDISAMVLEDLGALRGMRQISAMAQENLDAARKEERQLVDSLWKTCCN